LLINKLRTGKNPPEAKPTSSKRKAKSDDERQSEDDLMLMEYAHHREKIQSEISQPLPDWVMALGHDLSKKCGMSVVTTGKRRGNGIVDVAISDNAWAVWGKVAIMDMVISFANRHGLNTWEINTIYPGLDEQYYWIDSHFANAVRGVPYTELVDGRVTVVYHPHVLRGSLLEQCQMRMIDMWRDRFGVDAVLVPVVQAERMAV